MNIRNLFYILLFGSLTNSLTAQLDSISETKGLFDFNNIRPKLMETTENYKIWKNWISERVENKTNATIENYCCDFIHLNEKQYWIAKTLFYKKDNKIKAERISIGYDKNWIARITIKYRRNGTIKKESNFGFDYSARGNKRNIDF